MATAEQLAEDFLKLMDGQEIPDIGIGLTQALSIFFAFCELDHAGGGEQAKKLFLSGVTNLSNAVMEDVQRMRQKGMPSEEIRQKLRKFIPDTADMVKNSESEMKNRTTH